MVTGAGKLRIRVWPGPRYLRGLNGSGHGCDFRQDLGDGSPHEDKDSAQVAVRYDLGYPSSANKRNNVKYNAAGRGVGATWNWTDATHGPNGPCCYDFDIPKGASRVNIVLVYTDIVHGHDADQPDELARDIAAVLGAWAGKKDPVDGLWSFSGLTRAVPLPATGIDDIDEPHGLPSQQQRDSQMTQINRILSNLTNHVILPRILVPRYDSGYDIYDQEE